MTTGETAGVSEVRRSASQVMFGYLPEQTVDINRGIWRVRSWRDAPTERNVDAEALRIEIQKQAKPWSDLGRDHGLAQKLESGRRALVLCSLARDRGVDVEPFPKLWICPPCKRVHRKAVGSCSCGATGTRNQIHFVCYCRECGSLEEPPIAACPTHRETRIRFPGTMAADRIVQDCPICSRELRRGFVGKRCSNCGQQMTPQVHRASSVYTPRSVAVVNPPTVSQRERIDNAGGGLRALSWVVAGMKTRWMDEAAPGPDAMRRMLRANGLSDALIERIVREAIESGEVEEDLSGVISSCMQERMQQEARHIAVAFSASRMQLSDLVAETPHGLRQTYEEEYPRAIAAAGLEAVEFVDRFPVLTGQFGYTRGQSSDASKSVLVPYFNQQGDYVVYGEIVETEALFVKLDPMLVANWLEQYGVAVDLRQSSSTARVAIANAIAADEHADELITTLVHSFAHRFIRLAAVHTGVERTSLAEFLVPTHLGFFVYAAARGDFVMGGLQAAFEGELHKLLKEFVLGEHRCALDPGCGQSGAACMACLHLGEPSCRLFNRSLNRRTLRGPEGFLKGAQVAF